MYVLSIFLYLLMIELTEKKKKRRRLDSQIGNDSKIDLDMNQNYMQQWCRFLILYNIHIYIHTYIHTYIYIYIYLYIYI